MKKFKKKSKGLGVHGMHKHKLGGLPFELDWGWLQLSHLQIHMKGVKVNNYLNQEKMKSELLKKEDEERI